jgi:hypothetical protein
VRAIIFFVVFATYVSTAWAESKPKSVPFKEVNSKVSEAFCKKMDECAKQKIPVKDCISQMKDAFQQNYNSLPQDKKLEVLEPDLKLCTQSIQSSTCDELKAAQKLNGCDFIEKLNPS